MNKYKLAFSSSNKDLGRQIEELSIHHNIISLSVVKTESGYYAHIIYEPGTLKFDDGLVASVDGLLAGMSASSGKSIDYLVDNYAHLSDVKTGYIKIDAYLGMVNVGKAPNYLVDEIKKTLEGDKD